LLSAEQLQAQHQALLHAIEHLREDSEATLSRYTENIRTELNVLKENVAAKREQDLEAMHSLNQSTRTVILVIVGVALLSFAFIAGIVFRAMGRMGLQMQGLARKQPLGPKVSVTWKAEQAQWLPSDTGAHPGGRLVSAIARIEQRLLALESLPARTKLALPHLAEPAKPKSKSRPAEAETASAKPREVPRVSLTLGEGSALGFLPQEVARSKFRLWRSWWAKLKRLFKRSLFAPKP
jgi:hypothetical protein